jgi:DNA-binding CsgD family transcriptional regulator
MSPTGALERGRVACQQLRWRDAHELLAEADAERPLGLDDLERMALAAYLIGEENEATATWTRAHREAVGQGDPCRAARQAFLIAAGLMFRGDIAPAQGWLSRAGRVLEPAGECAEGAWLTTLGALIAMFAGDPSGSRPVFVAGVEAGERFADLDLVAMARVGEGMCGVMLGEVDEGLTLLDEAMVAVTAGEVSPVYAGMTYCTVIAACAECFDLRRAREWTAALTRWCDAQPDLVPFRGNCLVHRCELMQLRGDWAEALETAREACAQLAGPPSWDTLGSAYYQLGELQRLRGEFDLAEQSYRRASEAGRRPEPGLALLRLADGNGASAAAMMRRALDETDDPLGRARLLGAYVEIALATGDPAVARTAADELAGIAAEVPAVYLQALAATAAGAVLVAESRAREALPVLRDAGARWRELDAPYEAAQVRVLVAHACRDLGDPDVARMELDGARETFERLGAHPDVRRLSELAPHEVGGLTTRELEVLRLLAAGKTNRAIARELGLAEKTAARHVSNIFTKIDVPSRSAATAYAYEHGLVERRG